MKYHTKEIKQGFDNVDDEILCPIHIERIREEYTKTNKISITIHVKKSTMKELWFDSFLRRLELDLNSLNKIVNKESK